MKKQNNERVIKVFFSDCSPYFEKSPREAIMRHYPKEPRKVIDEMVQSYIHDIVSALSSIFQVEDVHAQQGEGCDEDVMFSFIAKEDWMTNVRANNVLWLATRSFDFENERMFAYMHVESTGYVGE